MDVRLVAIALPPAVHTHTPNTHTRTCNRRGYKRRKWNSDSARDSGHGWPPSPALAPPRGRGGERTPEAAEGRRRLRPSDERYSVSVASVMSESVEDRGGERVSLPVGVGGGGETGSRAGWRI